MINLYDSWLKSAAVRRNINLNAPIDDGYFCPINRQPLLNFAREKLDGHPEQEVLLNNLKWIALQSFYFYLLEVASVETAFICRINAGIINNSYSVVFSPETKMVASTIITDEGYHTNMALVAIEKLKGLTNIMPAVTVHNSNVYVIRDSCRALLPENLYNDFDLIVNCILENILTKDLDLVLLNKGESQLNSFTSEVLEQHFRDEARHSIFAYMVLELFWKSLDDSKKIQLLPAIKYFVDKFLTFDILQDTDFNRILLASQNISYETALSAMEYSRQYHYKSKEILKQGLKTFLQKCGIEVF